MSLSSSPHWCSPFRQGSSPKYLLVKIRSGSVIILRMRERGAVMRTLTLLTACLNRNCPSKVGPPISSSKESFVPFLRRSPRPSNASGWCFKPSMPFQDKKRRGAALHWHRELFLSHLTTSRAPRLSGESTSRIASVFSPAQAFNLSFKDSFKIIFPFTARNKISACSSL